MHLSCHQMVPERETTYIVVSAWGVRTIQTPDRERQEDTRFRKGGNGKHKGLEN